MTNYNTTTAVPPPKVIKYLDCIDPTEVEELLREYDKVDVMFYGYREKISVIYDKEGKAVARHAEMIPVKGFGARITSTKDIVPFSDRSNIKLLSDKTVEELR